MEEDEQLIEAVQRGDERACRLLMDRYEELVFKVVLARLDASEWSCAEETVQATFLDAFRRIRRGDYASTPLPFKRWLCRIARSKTTDLIRRQIRSRKPLEAARDMAEIRGELHTRSPDSLLMLREDLETVSRSIAELSEEDQFMLRRRALEGLTYEEIANEFPGLTANKVRSRIHRIRQRIRSEFRKRRG